MPAVRSRLSVVLRLCGWLLLALCGLGPAGTVSAQTLESVLRPGEVIAGHAKWEDDCAACHVRFDRAAQDRLCMDCHEDVGRDVKTRAGMHGRLPAQACRTCHTDHKGRQARIVDLDTKRFDHRQTDYALHGKHRQVECTACHAAGKKWRDAPQTCDACHREDDVHKGSLGAACADCHTESSWQQTRFDHTKTRFALTGQHIDAACSDCHRTPVYADAPETCMACHRTDDDKRGHRGRFGAACETCHTTQDWKPSRFVHDRDTRFGLRGAHRAATCQSCHTGDLYRDKLGSACIDCHRGDDKHKGSLGTACASCHTEARWTEAPKFDHAKTRYPLLGRHQPVPCASCHVAAPRYQVADQRCVACHRKDDKHDATLGETCESCHNERGWKPATGFDHAKARFDLRGAHLKAACGDCHRDARYREAPSECVACHRQDDRHEGQLGERCDSCHTDTRWDDARFDHAKARFALTGRHLAITCQSCHVTPRYRDAARTCIGCHQEDDRHRASLGTACESCHNTRDWRLWTFDHGRRTRFALDGAHRPLACSACHAAPAPSGQAIAPVGDTCVACHRADDRHDGAFGSRCEQCHVASDWKRVRPRAGGANRGTP